MSASCSASGAVLFGVRQYRIAVTGRKEQSRTDKSGRKEQVRNNSQSAKYDGCLRCLYVQNSDNILKNIIKIRTLFSLDCSEAVCKYFDVPFPHFASGRDPEMKGEHGAGVLRDDENIRQVSIPHTKRTKILRKINSKNSVMINNEQVRFLRKESNNHGVCLFFMRIVCLNIKTSCEQKEFVTFDVYNSLPAPFTGSQKK
jgi:hypothetical protein